MSPTAQAWWGSLRLKAIWKSFGRVVGHERLSIYGGGDPCEIEEPMPNPNPLFRRARNVLCVALLMPIVVAGSGGQTAIAAQFDVTTTADTGPGSLRQALLDAAAAAGADDVIVQPALGVITLSSEIAWTGVPGPNPVSIDGNGVHVDFNGSSRGFVDDGGQGLTIDEMTITGVGGSAASDAAPVLSEGGDMVLDHCTISGNTVTTTNGDVAGAVLSESGSVTIRNCTISGNVANGTGDGAGGVLSEGGALNVSDSTIDSNTVNAGGDAGGGLASEGGDVSLTGVTVNCNHATAGPGADAGGGLLSEGGSVTVDSSTFAGNSATASVGGTSGNGILSEGPAPVLTNTTVTDDPSVCTQGGGLVPGGPTNKASSDCYLELRVSGIENQSPQVEESKKIFCTDGEACDLGPCGDNVCTMRASACINQTDPNLPDCTPPAGLDKVAIKNKLSIQVPQLLQGPTCGPDVEFDVTATFNKKGKYQAGKSKQALKGKAKAPKGTKPRSDSDKWIIQCQPREDACPGSASGAFWD